MLTGRNLGGFFLSVAVTTAVLCAGPAPARAQVDDPPPPLYGIDENGHGTLNFPFPGFSLPLPFSIIRDPGPGGLPNVLAYDLLLSTPSSLVEGDVLIIDADGVSDLIRFNSTVGGGTLFFYSDQDGGINALADIGLPTGRNTNIVSINELSDFDEAIYISGAGQPGAGARAFEYVFISDPATAVPEPGSLLLLSAGFAGLAGITWTRHRRR